MPEADGVGPQGALGLKVQLSDITHFKNGREASACIALISVQHSSGSKQRIGGIAKTGGRNRLRCILFEGAMAVIRQLERREPRTHKELWLQNLIARRGKKVAAIALANKNVRTTFSLIKTTRTINQHY